MEYEQSQQELDVLEPPSDDELERETKLPFSERSESRAAIERSGRFHPGSTALSQTAFKPASRTALPSPPLSSKNKENQRGPANSLVASTGEQTNTETSSGTKGKANKRNALRSASNSASITTLPRALSDATTLLVSEKDREFAGDDDEDAEFCASTMPASKQNFADHNAKAKSPPSIVQQNADVASVLQDPFAEFRQENGAASVIAGKTQRQIVSTGKQDEFFRTGTKEEICKYLGLTSRDAVQNMNMANLQGRLRLAKRGVKRNNLFPRSGRGKTYQYFTSERPLGGKDAWVQWILWWFRDLAPSGEPAPAWYQRILEEGS